MLCENGYKVTAIARDNESSKFCTNIVDLKWLTRDIASSPLSIDELKEFDTIIHLAGATEGRGDDYQLHFCANEMTTTGMANHHSTSIKKFIFASSQVGR